MEQKVKKIKKFSGRADLQAFTITALYTLVAAIVVALIFWHFCFNVMMVGLEERTLALYHAVEKQLDTATFDFDSVEDMETDLYKKNKEHLLFLKEGAGVLYLYTAKKTEDGEFVYLIDGLEEHEDFRNVGDPIEEEIIEKLEIALGNKIVMPSKILDTAWGRIFISYLPIHNEVGEVVGVLGVEFDASDIYNVYKELHYITPLVIIALVISGVVVARYLFRRISNPLYLDGATEDEQTNLKNRNAYDVDLNNLMVRRYSNDVGIIMIDINGLKEVNDRLGHRAGDDYIRLVAEAIRDCKDMTMIPYRTGGDEFVLLVEDANEEKIKDFLHRANDCVKNQKKFSNMRCSFSSGYGIYDEKKDSSLQDTYDRADEAMYADKAWYKKNSLR